MNYYGSIVKQDGTYIYLEFCGGGSIAELIKKNGKVSEVIALGLVRELLSTMAYMNKKSIIIINVRFCPPRYQSR